jgi:hypothetical protein
MTNNPRFSKKHYCAIAEVLRECRENEEIDQKDSEMFIAILSDLFLNDNPRFNIKRFKETW